MRTLELQDDFGLDHLRIADRPDPEPGPGQVLLRMEAVALNYRDLLMVTGKYDPKLPLPAVPCSDGVGTITAVGPGVRSRTVGERVVPLFVQGWIGGRPDASLLHRALGGRIGGTLAELVVLDEDGVAPAPAHLDGPESATLPCAGVTAWNALAFQDSVGPEDTVLVQGTGGVALWAVQLAVLRGARVILTSSSRAKLERAAELGTWKGIDYVGDPQWGKSARKLTDGVGVDHVVELGGAGTLDQSLRAIRPGGVISLIGNLAGNRGEIDLVRILMQNVRVQGVFVGSREVYESLARAISHHELQPVVDRVFPFEESREAFVYLAGKRHFGKVCIRFD